MAITSDLNLQDKNDNNWLSLKSKRLVNKRTQKRAERILPKTMLIVIIAWSFMPQTSIK